jgi:hypothetical protein
MKKGQEFPQGKLVMILIVLAIGILLSYILYGALLNDDDIASGIEICKKSVDAREYAARTTSGIARQAAPLLCRTFSLEMPEKQYDNIVQTDFSKAVMMNIADRAMDCWYQFGEGMYDKNIFSGTGIFSKNQCFVCFNFTIKDDKNYEHVLLEDFDNFVALEPYKPIPNYKPFCIPGENDENCVSPKASECEIKGGYCSENMPGLIEFEGWSCDSRKKKCFISSSMLETYSEYMLNKAVGVFTANPNLYGIDQEKINDVGEISNLIDHGFTKDKEYGIAFIVHTRDIGWTVVGVAAGLTGIALTVASGGSFGLVVLGKAALVTAAGSGGDAIMDIIKRSPPTIYITGMDDIQEKCKVVGDFNQKK